MLQKDAKKATEKNVTKQTKIPIFRISLLVVVLAIILKPRYPTPKNPKRVGLGNVIELLLKYLKDITPNILTNNVLWYTILIHYKVWFKKRVLNKQYKPYKGE